MCKVRSSASDPIHPTSPIWPHPPKQPLSPRKTREPTQKTQEPTQNNPGAHPSNPGAHPNNPGGRLVDPSHTCFLHPFRKIVLVYDCVYFVSICNVFLHMAGIFHILGGIFLFIGCILIMFLITAANLPGKCRDLISTGWTFYVTTCVTLDIYNCVRIHFEIVGILWVWSEHIFFVFFPF